MGGGVGGDRRSGREWVDGRGSGRRQEVVGERGEKTILRREDGVMPEWEGEREEERNKKRGRDMCIFICGPLNRTVCEIFSHVGHEPTTGIRFLKARAVTARL